MRLESAKERERNHKNRSNLRERERERERERKKREKRRNTSDEAATRQRRSACWRRWRGLLSCNQNKRKKKRVASREKQTRIIKKRKENCVDKITNSMTNKQCLTIWTKNQKEKKNELLTYLPQDPNTHLYRY